MSTSNCGCGPAPKGEMLLVAATASEASTCQITTNSGYADCAKQEFMYDVCLNDLAVPATNSFSSMQVCNPNIYAVGMWLQFLGNNITLNISGITGKFLTVVNRVTNGLPVQDVGQIIQKNTRFVVVDSPTVLTPAEKTTELTEALVNIEEMVVPTLRQSSPTAIVQPVGRVESDPSNLAAPKGIRRIFGVMFNAGTPILSRLSAIGQSEIHNYRRLGINRTTNKVVELKAYQEYSGLVSGKQYSVVVTDSSERVIGPSYLTTMFRKLVVETSTSDDESTWDNVTTSSYNHDFDLEISEVTALPSNLDHFYALMRLEVNLFTSGSDKVAELLMNGGKAFRATLKAGISHHAIVMPVKVLRADYNLNIRVNVDDTLKMKLRATIDGMYF